MSTAVDNQSPDLANDGEASGLVSEDNCTSPRGRAALRVAVISVSVPLVYLLITDFVKSMAYWPFDMGLNVDGIALNLLASLLELPLLLLALPGCIVLPVALALSLRSVRRTGRFTRTWVVLGAFSAGVILAIAAQFVFLHWFYVAAFTPVTWRAQPLIEAIETHHTERGTYPETLEDLVPDFIAEVPYTGLAGYPQFEYARGEEIPYTLWVDTAEGFIDFDQFIYWPTGNYEDHYWGGWIEPIGDWVYFHE